MGVLSSCLSLYLSLSIHTGMVGDYNNLHPHVQCEKDGYITGMYYNSESELSVYLGKQYKVGEHWTIDTGLVTGYEARTIQPMLRFKRKRWYFAPTYEIIKYSDRTNIGVIVGYEVEFRKPFTAYFLSRRVHGNK